MLAVGIGIFGFVCLTGILTIAAYPPDLSDF